MSMPSSSDDVATMAFNSPAFMRFSTVWRISFDSEPWWEKASRLLCPSLMFCEIFSHVFLALQKINVE